MVVDSPPGMMSASAEASSEVVRTSNGSPPAPRTARACASKSPWRARTPTFTVLPASFGEALRLRHRTNVEPAHRLAQTTGHLREHVGVVEIGRRLDDGFRARGRVLALEDAATHEHALCAELHHQSCVGRRRYAACAEQNDGQTTCVVHLANQLERRA